MVKKVTNIIMQVIEFCRVGVWRIRVKNVEGMKGVLIRQLRIVLLAIRGFTEDKCQLRASALTFFSLLSIVPVVAMAFGIAKGFGVEQLLEKQLYERLQGQEEVTAQIIQFANTFLENSKGGVIAGVGIVVLFWSVIKVLGNIESSFNDIWGIKKSRHLGRKFTDYLSIMLICPILLIMSSSLTVLIISQVKNILAKITILGPVAPFIMMGINLLPYAVIWVLFTFLYIFLPNTKVKFKSGLVGGIIAGSIYQIVQCGYITFQVGVSKYGAIYGSFAALPLFLVWLQISWLIVLLGAEVAFAEQNVETYEFEPDCLKVSHAFKRCLSVAIMQGCVKRFHEGLKPQSADEISHDMEIPIRLMNQILFELTEAGLLSEVKDNESVVSAYQPAMDIEDLSIMKVVAGLDVYGIESMPIVETSEFKAISKALIELREKIEGLPENVLLKNI